jgi:hypothetical protein
LRIVQDQSYDKLYFPLYTTTQKVSVVIIVASSTSYSIEEEEFPDETMYLSMTYAAFL